MASSISNDKSLIPTHFKVTNIETPYIGEDGDVIARGIQICHSYGIEKRELTDLCQLILKALEPRKDEHLDIPIISLGIIPRIIYDSDNKSITLIIVPTVPWCPSVAEICADSKKLALTAIEGDIRFSSLIHQVDAVHDAKLVWNPYRIVRFALFVLNERINVLNDPQIAVSDEAKAILQSELNAALSFDVGPSENDKMFFHGLN